MKEKVADTSQLLTVNLGKVQNPNWRRIGANSGIMNSASEAFALKGAYIIITSWKYTICLLQFIYRKLVPMFLLYA